MIVHFFAAARAAAGVAEQNISVSVVADSQAGSSQASDKITLAQLISYLESVHTGRTPSGLTMAQILAQCSFLVNGQATEPSTPLNPDARVDVLPPFAGG